MSAKKVCYFQEDWRLNKDFSNWIGAHEDRTKAKCSLCVKSFSVANMGISALRSHMASAKHVLMSKCTANNSVMKQFLKSSAQVEGKLPCSALEAKENGGDKNSASVQGVLQITRDDVVRAEILWACKVVISRSSYNSCAEISKLFGIMFPDSQIAKTFTCGPDKCSYLVCHGIAPYFKKRLDDAICRSPFYALSFDECFNKTTQNEQMDIICRYWDPEVNQVRVRYVGSEFLGHARSKDLLEKFNQGSAHLPANKLLQISMDGPSVNWKFLEELQQHRREVLGEEGPKILQLGSCGLHVVHGTVQDAMHATDWKLDNVLKSLWHLFKDSPARRDDYISITGSSVFPLKFCVHRWVEDLKVAQRAIEIWSDVVKYLDHVSKLCKSKQPTANCYAVLQDARRDPLIIAKLEFFVSVVKPIHMFLVRFQTDSPMVPYLGNELYKLLRLVDKRFVKQETLDKADTAFKLCKLDVTDRKF